MPVTLKEFYLKTNKLFGMILIVGILLVVIAALSFTACNKSGEEKTVAATGYGAMRRLELWFGSIIKRQ